MSMKIGLQIYTVRNSFKKDPMGTLEKISALGYKVIELANHRADKDPGTGLNIGARQLKLKADEVGISIIGGHVMPEDSNMIDGFYKQEDNINHIIEYYNELGSKYIVIPIDFFPTKDYLLKRCKLYNKIGEVFYKAGLNLLYHNHFHDFQCFDDEYIFDIILDNTDPKYMNIELDAYWAMRGGMNPAETIRQYGNRISIIHGKDFPLDQIQYFNAWNILDQYTPLDWDGFQSVIKPEYFTEIGEGIIKIQDVIDAGNEFNIPYFLVELDITTMGEIDSIAKSMSNLKKMRDLNLS